MLGNAIKYTPEGGEIKVFSMVSNGKIQVDIRDNGIGIPAEALPQLFQKFYRVHSSATQDIEGNGLGLAIAEKIIHEHGGKVAILSKVGVGTTVEISLPTKPLS